MNARHTALIIVIAIISSALLLSSRLLTGPTPSENGMFQIVERFPQLSFDRPLDLQSARDGSNRLFVVEQTGKIHVFENSPSVTVSSVFLDLSGRITRSDIRGDEEGLLGLAFHPDYESNGYFFVDYTADSPRRTVVSRFSVDADDSDVADPSSEKIILQVAQPYANHNGGQLQFGPDGYLYIAMGDGGGAGDPQGNAQNRSTLLGAILRIDTDTGDPGLNYSIPEGNPFAGNTEGYREEIYAYGLRNPWRFSFDNATGDLWAADVGQNTIEEIDTIEAGGNYGWNIKEGTSCYSPATGCNSSGLIDPVFEYDHSLGRSVTGGFVYRGQSTFALFGLYIYADYISGRIWSLNYSVGAVVENRELFDTNLFISSFGIDDQNELYFLAFDGKVYTIQQEIQTTLETTTSPSDTTFTPTTSSSGITSTTTSKPSETTTSLPVEGLASLIVPILGVGLAIILVTVVFLHSNPPSSRNRII